MFSGKICTEKCIAVGARRRGGGAGLSLSWTDHGVSWYNGNSGTDAAEFQLNKSGTTYHYLAFGYDGEA